MKCDASNLGKKKCFQFVPKTTDGVRIAQIVRERVPNGELVQLTAQQKTQPVPNATYT